MSTSWSNRPAISSIMWRLLDVGRLIGRGVRVQERDLLGIRPVHARASVTLRPVHALGHELDYVEPYFLDQRMSLGVGLFAKQSLANSYISYGTTSYGGSLKLGSSAARRSPGLQLRYSLYETKHPHCRRSSNDCNNINPDFVNSFPDTERHRLQYRERPFGRACCLACGQRANKLFRLFGQASLARAGRAWRGDALSDVFGWAIRADIQHAGQ